MFLGYPWTFTVFFFVLSRSIDLSAIVGKELCDFLARQGKENEIFMKKMREYRNIAA